MKKIIAVGAISILAQFGSSPAAAGPYGDEMAKCIVAAATEEDRKMLVQWIFSVMALHPNVRQLAPVSDAARAGLDKRMGDLTMALLTERCVKETRAALKNEGGGTLETSFGVLGKVAMQDLFVDTNVQAGIAQFSKNLDETKLKALVEPAK